jgi:hypothetical protein
MQHGKRRIKRRSALYVPKQERPYRTGRSGEKRLTRTLLGRRQTTLEQLPDDAEREPGLELRATRVQNLPPDGAGTPVCFVEKRGLTDASPTLDDDRATLCEQLIDRRQLAFPLKQRRHANTVGRAARKRQRWRKDKGADPLAKPR